MSEIGDPTFNSLKLLPGQILQLEFEGYNKNRNRSQLVGYYKDRSIIISTPIQQGIAVSVKLNTKVKVRLFVNQTNGACAFESIVIHVSVTPFPHLYLTMPDRLVLGEVRKSTRAAANIITSVVIITIDGQRKSVPSVIGNLSVDGARLSCQQLPTALNEEINIVFKVSVSDIEHIMRITATVRSIQFDEARDTHFHGLEFVDVKASEHEILRAFVLSQPPSR